MNKKEQGQISIPFLQTTEEEPKEHKIKPIKCPTCQQNFLTTQDLNKHRDKVETCRTTWKIDQAKNNYTVNMEHVKNIS